LPPRSTDDEASELLDQLSRLQTWCILQARHDRGASAAADLVQLTRVFIIERCKRPTSARAQAQEADRG
jgi:hypothetical protein